MADTQLEQLLTAYAEHPSLPGALNEAANTYRRHGHYADAIRLFEAALAKTERYRTTVHGRTGTV